MKNYCFNSNIYIYQKEAKWKATEINTIRKVLKVTNIKKNGLTKKEFFFHLKPNVVYERYQCNYSLI